VTAFSRPGLTRLAALLSLIADQFQNQGIGSRGEDESVSKRLIKTLKEIETEIL
jgi:hypothetical protein